MIESLAKSLSILEFIAAQQAAGPVSITAICRQFRMPQPTVSHIVRTLYARRYLDKEGRRGYVLGPMPYQLTGGQPFRADLVYAARESVETLSREISSLVYFNTLLENRLIILYSANNNPNTVQVKTDVLSPANPLETATGHVLAAWLEPEPQDAFIAAYTGGAGQRRATPLRRKLARVKQNGFAQVDDTSSHLAKIAFPVFRGADVVAALGSQVLTFQVNRIETVIRAVRKSAGRISRELTT